MFYNLFLYICSASITLISVFDSSTREIESYAYKIYKILF